ncbi:serine hydrolase [Brevundimonas sp. R86498]|uniref:serine hydrolase n=1 Tax=Brevundimonas sp. R86498 TaxID=3093845 RepID=UPI0037CC689D
MAAALAWGPAFAEYPLIPVPVQASVRAAVDDGGRVGVVIGYHRDGRSAFFSYGSTAVDDGRPVDPDTIFEVGSVTKLFTAETLAAMAVAGEVELDTTLAEIWPERRSAGRITLGDLATHRAGLPRDIPAGALIGNDEMALLAALELVIFRRGHRLLQRRHGDSGTRARQPDRPADATAGRAPGLTSHGARQHRL